MNGLVFGILVTLLSIALGGLSAVPAKACEEDKVYKVILMSLLILFLSLGAAYFSPFGG